MCSSSPRIESKTYLNHNLIPLPGPAPVPQHLPLHSPSTRHRRINQHIIPRHPHDPLHPQLPTRTNRNLINHQIAHLHSVPIFMEPRHNEPLAHHFKGGEHRGAGGRRHGEDVFEEEVGESEQLEGGEEHPKGVGEEAVVGGAENLVKVLEPGGKEEGDRVGAECVEEAGKEALRGWWVGRWRLVDDIVPLGKCPSLEECGALKGARAQCRGASNWSSVVGSKCSGSAIALLDPECFWFSVGSSTATDPLLLSPRRQLQPSSTFSTLPRVPQPHRELFPTHQQAESIMRASPCLYNSAAALRRVFLESASASAPLLLQTILLPRLSVAAATATILNQTRCPFSTQGALQVKWGKRKPGQDEKKDAGLPRDLAIKEPWVYLRGLDGRLTEKQRPADIINRLDRIRYSLAMVWAPPKPKPGEPEPEKDENLPDWPVCVIVDRRAEAAALQAKAKEERRKQVSKKELEINWAIAAHDLGFRTRQLQNFLRKGHRVEIMLLQKKDKKQKKTATQEECQEVVRMIREAVAEVPKVQEVKPMDGQVGKVVRMVFQGPTPKKNKEDAAAEEEEKEEKDE
ncbi:hypothetical protein NEUTE1DRAFT_97679 [Neurospora tetrasperma FGSC 2508]|uniref:Translation initiation factor 3 C-terminal domain-containing protein n=1 Tax=Neurospora tetrasperma (strain FGSC 2508 / ATCC MYA-4615 / P0657) TaxID=510951 RepID=F8MCR5_NEUT8|nr:uncharacterized protein NEUTE1DRAFT_97679 [Neurospora tetrasperma FGSC 2508]EGO60512.1 hypothetical protein NEUTE1DRAFT_97679 [Neurospora tetrasperma FGSC 2508]